MRAGNSIESDGALIGDRWPEPCDRPLLAWEWVRRPYSHTWPTRSGWAIAKSRTRWFRHAWCGGAGSSFPPIALNDWAARDLGAKPGDLITLEYYVWKEEGRLATETAKFTLASIVPLKGAGDRDLAPEYPGMTDSESLHDWDPPFPVDLRRVRPRDEDYWKTYKTTPKAFIPLETGQQLWGSRFGKITSIRLTPPAGTDIAAARDAFEKRLRETVDPLQSGLALLPVRAQGLSAAQGSTDFGEYFTYFSFFPGDLGAGSDWAVLPARH